LVFFFKKILKFLVLFYFNLANGLVYSAIIDCIFQQIPPPPPPFTPLPLQFRTCQTADGKHVKHAHKGKHGVAQYASTI
jgi:hypothetical protein